MARSGHGHAPVGIRKSMIRLRNWLVVATTLLVLHLAGSSARAQLSCFAGVSNLAFGTVDVLSGLAEDSAGTITTGCTGILTGVTELIC